MDKEMDEGTDFSDLIDDIVDEEPDESPVEDGEPEPEPEAEEAEAEESAGEPEPSDEEEAEEPVKFKYKGKEYSLEDLKADKKLREKFVTGANQQSHFQELYEEQRRKAEEAEKKITQIEQYMIQRQQQAQQAQQAQQRPQQPQITPHILKSAYERSMDEMSEGGWIEEDLKEMYPNTVSGILYLRDQLLSRIGVLEQAVGGLASHTQAKENSSVRESTWSRIHSNFDRVAAEGGMFEALADQQTRQDFLTYLEQTVNPEIQALVSEQGVEVIKALWAGKNRDAYFAAVKENRQADPKATERRSRARMAAGESGGRKSGGSGGKTTNPLEGTGFEDLF